MTEPRRAAEETRSWFNFLEILQEPESPRRRKTLYDILNDEGGVEDPISVDEKYATGGVVGESSYEPDLGCGYVIHNQQDKESK